MDTAKELPVMRTLQAAALAHWKRKGTWKALLAVSRLATSGQRISDVLGVVRAPNTAPLIIQKPDTVLKWSGKYLAKNLLLSERSHMLAFHYRFVGARIHDAFYACLLSEGFVLWNVKTDAGEVALRMRYSQSPREGDLALIMTCDRANIYELSFTIVPGEFVHASGPVMLVGRVQGRKYRFEAIKKATKLCGDVSPPYVLMAAIEGIAAALGVECVAGVSNINQIHAHKSFNYESFWETLSFAKTGSDFYASALPLASRPLDQCSPEHRRRTKKKRVFKAGVAISVQSSFKRQCLKESQRIGYERHVACPDVSEMVSARVMHAKGSPG